jgi:hypothetical protein
MRDVDRENAMVIMLGLAQVRISFTCLRCHGRASWSDHTLNTSFVKYIGLMVRVRVSVSVSVRVRDRVSILVQSLPQYILC